MFKHETKTPFICSYISHMFLDVGQHSQNWKNNTQRKKMSRSIITFVYLF